MREHFVPSREKEEEIQAHLKAMAGGHDIRGMQISHHIRLAGKLFDMAVTRSAQSGEISGPRMGILMRLYMEAEHGDPNGVNPGALGRFMDVKKNTISALLDGLEEAGYVERAPHPTDGRASLVRITLAGREFVCATTPRRFKFMNEITSVLSTAEQDELIRLLTKLHQSLSTHVKNLPCDEA
jgi:DNA-binding MarR family transcriptional regulator